MFETRDGKTFGLHDTIFVISLARKVNKARRVYASTKNKNTDVAIYAMEVTRKKEYVAFRYDHTAGHEIPIDLWEANGLAWLAIYPKPILGQESKDCYVFDDIHAEAFNTFFSLEEAQKALPVFQERGYINLNGIGMYADDYYSETNN